MALADERIHGTTHETPRARFEREERMALRPLPVRALPRREQRVRRRVANDAFVDLDTVRYSVPHRLVAGAAWSRACTRGANGCDGWSSIIVRQRRRRCARQV
jgi:hypothetical protein